MYGDRDPFARPGVEPPLTFTTDELTLSLPLADRDDLDLARKGDDIIVTAGSYRRVITLPAALARREISSAVLRDGRLRVRFQAGGAK